MSPTERNEHKSKQAAYSKHKRIVRALLISNKYPYHYSTAYRKSGRFSKLTSDASYNAIKRISKKLKVLLQHTRKVRSIYEVYAWNRATCARGFEVRKGKAKQARLLPQLFGVIKHPYKGAYKNGCLVSARRSVCAQANKLVYWNVYLPTYYLLPLSKNNSIIDTTDFVYVVSTYGSIQFSKAQYGSLLILDGELTFTDKGRVREWEIVKFNSGTGIYISAALNENAIIKLYSLLAKQHQSALPIVSSSKVRLAINRKTLSAENRGHIKHVVRMRYRWFFQPKLSQFKLFRKFFKRSLKRYRKINKNKLFVNKFRSHFPKLTGFTEKGLLKLWLPFRRNYNQYWSTSNAALRFSQSLLLSPTSLLVFLQLSPSFAASKHIIKSGAVSINGLAVTAFTQFKPGDIMQLNFVIWKSVYHFFDYQRWNNDFRALQYVPFLQVDWSSLMFMMIRWPRKYELVAPSFISERWIRYYIRQFPSKIRNFKKTEGNWKVYKRIITKR